MKILIAGKNGQLARTFARTCEARGVEYSAPEETELDITDASRVDVVVSSFRPTVILNCAAYNLVDKAEEVPDRATLINATGAGNLARAAGRAGATIVHYSSDYVFDGAKENGLYSEEDPANPLNAYGRSKLEGEQLVRTATDRHLVLRLSWVFGPGTQNFIHKLQEWASRSAFLRIACDEFSVPTSTRTIAEVTLQALEQGLTGTHHLTNSGYCSRYEWARLVLDRLGIRKFIRPVSMDLFALPAKRPKFSAMSSAEIASRLGITIPDWQEAVSAFLSEKER